MSYLQIKNLWMTYDDQVVLERVNLTVEKQSFCTIVGASGCGKTTFLRLLLSQEKPSKGQIILDGNALPEEPGPDRGIVFQRYSVFPHLSVLNNVMLGLELETSPLLGRAFGKRRRRIRQQAEQALEAVGLIQAKDKFPAALSGGMQQRLSIAQSIIKRPKILLLDEPFGALDPGIRTDMHEMILQLWRHYQMTVFMITHDIKEGFQLGTRLLVFDKVRLDPQAPQAYGATVTYDIPLQHDTHRYLQQIDAKQKQTEHFLEKMS